MEVIATIYKITEVESKNIKILMPSRVLIGQEENNVMTVGEEKIEHISRTNYENGKKCYVESLPYEDIKKQIGENGEITDEEIIKSLVETANEEVIYIENNDVKELEKETFQNNYNLSVDYNTGEISENMTVKQIAEIIKQKIMFQDYAIKKILSTIVNNGYMENPKSIVLIGSKGVGKTKIVDLMAKVMNSPYSKIEDYSGEELTNSYITLLLNKENGSKAGPAIVFIDGINMGIEKLGKIDGDIMVETISKIIKTKTKTFIPITDEKIVMLDPNKINYIIALDLNNIIQSPKTVNFSNEENDKKSEIISKLREMLVDANCEIIDMNNLTEENLKQILIKSEISPINEYNKILNTQGLKIKVSKKAYELIAHEAYTLNKGAKGLSIITDYILKDDIIDAQFNGNKDIYLTEKKVLTKIKNTNYKKRLY